MVAKRGILRAREVVAEGVDDKTLHRILAKGLIQRVGRGLYISADATPSSNVALAVVARRVGHGVVCLLSALSFHGITTQLPREVWLAVNWKPTIGTDEWPPIRTLRFSGDAFTEGVEVHQVYPASEENVSNSVAVRVYSPAKTVADCFKFRGTVGLDVAIEALRDTLQHQKASRDEIWQYAKLCRVHNVMRPYLEATA